MNEKVQFVNTIPFFTYILLNEYFLIRRFASSLTSAFSLTARQVYTQDPKELEKILFLISSVEGLKGALFIWNSREYSVKTAADTLRLALKKSGDNVRTVDDFIILCGSGSFFGAPCKIRLFGGKTIETEDYFWETLKTFNSRQK